MWENQNVDDYQDWHKQAVQLLEMARGLKFGI